jgi:malonate transporter
VLGVLEGFAIIGFVIFVGYIVGRSKLLGDNADQVQYVLSRLVFFVASPCLLFTVLAEADVRDLFSRVLAVSAISAFTAIILFLLVARLAWRRALPESVIGAAGSGYVNANNIGIPVAVYVLGNPALSAPVILLQLVVLAPIILIVMDVSTSGHASLRTIFTAPFRNPLIIASLLGVIISVSGITVPKGILAPFVLIGGASVPVVLLAFGMSLYGRKLLEPGTDRKDVILASAIKLLVMPVVAWVVGDFVFHLTGTTLFGCVVLAALPTAQNVLNYAQRYNRGVTMARDTVLITTVGAVPVLVAAAALLK